MNAPSAGSGSAAPGVEEELTAALVRAFDREHALRSLAQLVLASLEDDLPVGEVLRRLVEEAVSLLDADGGAYVDGTAVEVVGDLAPGADPALTVGGLAVDPVSEVTVHLGEQGRRVAMLLDEPGSPGADAPGRRGIVLCRIAGAPFDTGEVNLAETVGVAARMVHSVNRLRAEAVVRARAAQELEAAAALAQSSLQRTLPSVPGVGLSAESVPAREAGGDFYLCEQAGGLLWTVVGDVAGKGLPAATVMTKALAATRVAIAQHPDADPALVVDAVGAELYDYLEQVGLFVTAVVATLDPATGALAVANAGHSPVLVATEEGTRALRPSCPPLGVVRGIPATTERLDLVEGDVLLLGSDGLVEQEDPRGRMLGQDLLSELLTSLRGRDVATCRGEVERSVERWSAGHEQGDDRTLVLLTRGAVAAADLALRPDAGDLRRLGPWLGETLTAAGLEEAEAAALQGRFELAVHEVCMNAVEHGGLTDADRILVRADVAPGSVTVVVDDPGRPVDLDAVPEPVPGVPQVGGYGVMIVRQLVDRFAHRRTERGNEWTMSVDRAAPAAGGTTP